MVAVKDGVVLAEEGVAEDPQSELVEGLHAKLAFDLHTKPIAMRQVSKKRNDAAIAANDDHSNKLLAGQTTTHLARVRIGNLEDVELRFQNEVLATLFTRPWTETSGAVPAQTADVGNGTPYQGDGDVRE